MVRIKVLLPQLGMGMLEGEMVRWLKQVGDGIDAGEPRVDVEAAKITVEVPPPGTGTVVEILVPAGESADVRSHIATIET